MTAISTFKSVSNPEVTGLVSVVIPAFRAGATIARAIASARAQSYPQIELVVVDDASDDDTLRVLDALSGADLRVIALHENVGAGEARNIGVRAAHGEYVAFLDADDEWHPDKIALQVAAAVANQAATIVLTDALMLHADGSHWRFHDRCPPATGSDGWKELLRRNFVPTPAVLARRAAILDVGGFEPSLVIGEDLDLWIRLAERGEVAVINQVLVNVYIRPDSLLRSHPRGELDYVIPMVDAHIARLAHRMTPRERRRIQGSRAFEIGYRLYRQDFVPEALPLFWRAATGGERVWKSLSFFPRALFKMARRTVAGLWGVHLCTCVSEFLALV